MVIKGAKIFLAKRIWKSQMLLTYHSSNLLLVALKPMRLILVHISFILKNTKILAIFPHNPLNNLSLIKLVFFTKCEKKAYFIRKSWHACGMDKKKDTFQQNYGNLIMKPMRKCQNYQKYQKVLRMSPGQAKKVNHITV